MGVYVFLLPVIVIRPLGPLRLRLTRELAPESFLFEELLRTWGRFLFLKR